MRALLRKELRELRTPVLAVLACALALGLIDVAYNWSEKRFVGLSLGFCLAASVLVSFFGGANAVARETADQKAFLGSWPLNRREIWLAKLAANLAAVLVASVLSYVICGGLLALHGYHFAETYLQITGLPLLDLAIFCLTLFAFGFSASWLATTALGATGIAAAMLAVPTVIWTLLMLGGLPERWGPFLGFSYEALSMEQQAFLEILPFLLFSAAVLVAGRKALLRYPILDMRQRTRLTYRLFAALSALSIGAGSVAVVALMPRPVVSPAHHVSLSANGRRLVLLSGPEAAEASAHYDSLWALSTMGGHPQLAARGPISKLDLSPDGRHVLFAWGEAPKWGYGPLWLADLDAGSVWRLPAARWPEDAELPALWSPSGNSLLLYGGGGLMLIKGHTVESSLKIKQQTRVIGWTKDENGIYSVAPAESPLSSRKGERPKLAQRPLWRTDLRTGQHTVVAQVSEDLDLKQVSPDGRWIVGVRSIQEWVKLPWGRTDDDLFPSSRQELQLVETASGAVHVLGALSAGAFTPDGRYLWCRYEPQRTFSSVANELRVIDLRTGSDLRTLSVAHTIPAVPPVTRQSPAGHGMVIVYSPQVPELKGFAAASGRAYLVESGNATAQRTPRQWIADADGGNFRSVRPFVGEFEGLTAQGDLVVWRKPAQFVRINPETAAETVIWQP